MIELDFLKKDGPLNVLCLGAHCDDIEIGCGGTLLKLIERYREIRVHWVVFSSNEVRAREATACADLFLKDVRDRTVVIKDFKNSFFPYVGFEIKEYFEEIKGHFSPDLVLTHYQKDLHQDHRVLCELTWNSFRDHVILEYEIPKYDGDLGAPSFFVSLDEATAKRKVDYIFQCFETQKDKHWFTEDTFLSLMRLRGIQSAAHYAEAFYVRKLRF